MKNKYPMILVAVFIIASSMCRVTPLFADANWPQFRGADSRGVSENPGLPDRWSDSENVEWKVDLEGRGWSSPVVWGDRVFLTTSLNQEKLEAPKKGLYFGGNRPKPKSASAHADPWASNSRD